MFAARDGNLEAVNLLLTHPDLDINIASGKGI
jgi:hypothetical protein